MDIVYYRGYQGWGGDKWPRIVLRDRDTGAIWHGATKK